MSILKTIESWREGEVIEFGEETDLWLKQNTFCNDSFINVWLIVFGKPVNERWVNIEGTNDKVRFVEYTMTGEKSKKKLIHILFKSRNSKNATI